MTSPDSRSRYISLVVFLALSFSASALGAFFQPGDWYAALEKPSWNPPSWVFGPVWTVLYVLIAVAAWRVWTRWGREASLAITVWGVQMVLNALWSYLFFGVRQPGLAFGEIVLLWLAIAATIWLFWRRDRIAALLLTPYLAWVSFAAVLNFTIWRLNV